MPRICFLSISLFLAIQLSFGQEGFVETTETVVNIALDDRIEKKKKILPFALPITEPAIGYGLIVGAILFLPKDDADIQSDMIVGGGGLTSNGTWFAGGGYFGFWNEDRIRYVGYVGGGIVTLKFYGLSDIGIGEPILFDQDVIIFVQQLKFRIGSSSFFVGGKYHFSQVHVPHNFRQDNFDDLSDLKFINSGVSLIVEYDKLDDFLSPSKGTKIHLSYDQNLEELGSYVDWGTFKFYSHFYFQASENWFPSFRLDARISTGNPPFYAYPYVELRGIPALRYQGEKVLVAETQQLYKVAKKWSVVGFAGIGSAFKSEEKWSFEEMAWNVGAGARYQPIKDMGVKLGADIARGPEDFAFYISIGSAW